MIQEHAEMIQEHAEIVQEHAETIQEHAETIQTVQAATSASFLTSFYRLGCKYSEIEMGNLVLDKNGRSGR
jgi:hypothetical protein